MISHRQLLSASTVVLVATFIAPALYTSGPHSEAVSETAPQTGQDWLTATDKPSDVQSESPR